MNFSETRFQQVSLLSEAVVLGLLVERNRHQKGFTATSFSSPWFPFIIAWDGAGISGRSSRLTQSAVAVCKDKLLTESTLREKGLPVLSSFKLSLGQLEDFLAKRRKQLSWPVVVKPVDGSLGKGVRTSIFDENALEQAFVELGQTYPRKKAYMVQRQVFGSAYRFLSSRDRTHAVFFRIPANVIGDGTSSIKELVKKKNALRSINPHLGGVSKEIRLSGEALKLLADQGHATSSVPGKGDQVWLSSIGNVNSGSDTVAVTDEVHPSLMELSARAVAAIPGLDFGGVDIVLEKGHQFSADDQNVTVLEINTRPDLGGHLYPMVGEPKNVCAVIVRETADAAGIPVMDRPDDLTIIGEVEHPRLPARQALDEVQDLGLLSAIAVKKENGFGFALSGPVDSITHAIKIASQQWGGVLRAVRDDNFAVPNGVSVRDDINIPALPPSPLPRVFGLSARKPGPTIGLRFVVSGTVQGVGYRQFIRRAANKRGITGWVKNRLDGKVEGVVNIPTTSKTEWVDILWRGPKKAVVRSVATTDTKQAGKENGFQVIGPRITPTTLKIRIRRRAKRLLR